MNSATNTYSSPSSLNPSYNSSLTSSTTGSGYGFFNMSVTTWIIIIVVLTFLGFNIFAYLAKGTQTLSDTLGPYGRYFGGLFGNAAASVTKNVTTTAATGAKAGIDIAAGTINSGVDVVQKTAGAVTGATASSSILNSQKTNASVPSENVGENNQINVALKNATPQSQETVSSFTADDSGSAIQSNKSSSKSGFCYIGEYRGVRSCVQVGENDTCMSGDIFPSQDICVNPSLRA